MVEKPFYGTYMADKGDILEDRFNYRDKTWQVAESIQPLLMQFKTGYRNVEKAKRAADALYKTIKDIERN